jgi:FkbM family methyltransferase
MAIATWPARASSSSNKNEACRYLDKRDRMMSAPSEAFGVFAPGWFDRAVLALTACLPDNRLGLRLAILLRRAVTMRMAYPDGALDVERWGMRLRLHPRDNGCEKNLLFTPQMYERIELAELAAEIARARQQGQPFVFIDIGANVGLFSLFVAGCAAKAARILAIEPEPGNLYRLNFNVHANPQAPIKVIAAALSDRAGQAAIVLDRRDRGGSRTINASRASADAILVPARPLLQLLAEEKIDAIDALKIDVEGCEDVILDAFFRDAPARLWPRLIVIEDQRASWATDVIAMLAARDYRITARSRQNLILRRFPEK